ncbi:MAG: YbhB/YbcL family Raf kinase inhibitor-like protein [Candidatus Omnitrophica bacterium]|nr:YbhB/YbcL family Raf kinase inhibitor-like protein [Candidatus Omnitrophota bacterium]
MELTSPEFKNNGSIPAKFTCEGESINPALAVKNIPSGTKSLALIVDDPDAVSGVWTHWIVYDIAPAAEIGENSVPGTQGINSARNLKYHGPCPPSGTHRYFFRLYALDTMLNLNEGINRQELERAMKGHTLAQAELIGLYKRTKQR